MAWDTNHVGNTYAKPGYDKAKSLWESGSGSEVYSGNRVAGFNDQQNNYFNQVGQNFGSTPGYMQAGQNTVGNVAQSGGINSDIQFNLDGLKKIADGSQFQDVLGQQLDEVQNRINRNMSAAGRYGSGAHMGTLASEMGDAASRALLNNQAQQMQAYSTGMQGRLAGQQQGLQASALSPTMLQGDITRLNELMKSGAIQQSQEQDELNSARDLFNEKQQTDWTQLSKYLSSIGQGSPVGSVYNEPNYPSYQAAQPSTAQSVLGGALTGASIGGMFGSPLLGGLAGGALGLFG